MSRDVLTLEDQLNRIANALEKLESLAEKLEGLLSSDKYTDSELAKRKAAGEKLEKPPKKDKGKPSPAPTNGDVTKEMVRESLLELTTADGCSRETALTVLSRFGATSVGKLAEKDYGETLALSRHVIKNGPDALKE